MASVVPDRLGEGVQRRARATADARAAKELHRQPLGNEPITPPTYRNGLSPQHLPRDRAGAVPNVEHERVAVVTTDLHTRPTSVEVDLDGEQSIADASKHRRGVSLDAR